MTTIHSKHTYLKFMQCFDHGCQFWTSEDGSDCEIVITRHLPLEPDAEPDQRLYAANVILREFAHVRGVKTRTVSELAKLLTPSWVEQEWAGADYFDGGSGRRRGKIWRLSTDPTPFPVYVFDPDACAH